MVNFYKEKDKFVFAGTRPQHNLFLFTTLILIELGLASIVM